MGILLCYVASVFIIRNHIPRTTSIFFFLWSGVHAFYNAAQRVQPLDTVFASFCVAVFMMSVYMSTERSNAFRVHCINITYLCIGVIAYFSTVDAHHVYIAEQIWYPLGMILAVNMWWAAAPQRHNAAIQEPLLREVDGGPLQYEHRSNVDVRTSNC